mgnify:CR=1 FL=1
MLARVIVMSVGGKHYLWDHEDPFCGCGAGDCENSKISNQHKDRLPRFGPRGTRKTLVLLWWMY